MAVMRPVASLDALPLFPWMVWVADIMAEWLEPLLLAKEETFALPKEVAHWSLTTQRKRLL